MKRKCFALLMVLIMSILCAFTFVGCSEIDDYFLETTTGQGYVRDGAYVTYGEYAQTIKEQTVEVSDIKDSRGYYYGLDGEYYAKVVASSSANGKKFSTGEQIVAGRVYYFKVEPIKWEIIKETNGELMVFSVKVLDETNRYGKSTNNYINSDIRNLLNYDFIQLAFAGYKTSLIKRNTVSNNVYSTGYEKNGYACGNTNDKIFLPSYREVFGEEYGTWNEERRMRLASDYLIAQGVSINTSKDFYGCTEYMLRSPANDDIRDYRIVAKDGTFSEKYVGYSCGYAPSLWLKVEN